MFILKTYDNLGPIEHTIPYPARTFPDGTLLLRDLPIYIDEIEWRYDSDAEFFTLLCLRQHYPDRHIDLLLPYIPHARMDRVKDASEGFTLKAFCQALNAMQFEKVVVFDPHSNVATALIDNVFVMEPRDVIEIVTRNIPANFNTTFFFPDEGAMKRYSKMFDRPFVFGMKDRDWKTGQIKSLQIVGDKSFIGGKDILIIDDICSKGGTFYHAAKALKERGAQDIYLYVSHCEDTVYSGDLITSGLVKKIFTTNSIFRRTATTAATNTLGYAPVQVIPWGER